MEPREVEWVLEGYKAKQKDDFNLMQIAVDNAIGSHFTKGFRPKNPFKQQEESAEKVKASTAEDKAETIAYLTAKFKEVGE